MFDRLIDGFFRSLKVAFACGVGFGLFDNLVQGNDAPVNSAISAADFVWGAPFLIPRRVSDDGAQHALAVLVSPWAIAAGVGDFVGDGIVWMGRRVVAWGEDVAARNGYNNERPMRLVLPPARRSGFVPVRARFMVYNSPIRTVPALRLP